MHRFQYGIKKIKKRFASSMLSTPEKSLRNWQFSPILTSVPQEKPPSTLKMMVKSKVLLEKQKCHGYFMM